MSARKEPDEKVAFMLPVERYTDGKGHRRMRAAIGGDEETARALVKYLEENADAHLETPQETAKARMFSGFGSGKMDASQGRRTKIVKKRGGGFSTAA